MKFLNVTVYSDYFSYDMLDGKELKENDLVDVRWPDGTEEPHVIHTTSTHYQGHGGMSESTGDTKAHIEVLHRGAWACVILRGSDVELRRRAP